jgi:hypothetical protein
VLTQIAQADRAMNALAALLLSSSCHVSSLAYGDSPGKSFCLDTNFRPD